MGVRREIAFRLAMSERFESLVGVVPGGRTLAYRQARRYVAGATLDEALDVSRRLLAEGLAVSLDAFGELVADPATAAAAAGAYAELITGAAALDGDVWVSVDLSHIGLDVSPGFCRTQLARITERLPAGMRLQVGAEDSGRCDAILDAVEDAVGRGAALTCTLQANLRRSMDDVPRIAALGIGVRLVKGAFVEPPSVAHPYGPETDLRYVELAVALRERGVEVLTATHDAALRELLQPDRVEMLLGVHEVHAIRLARAGTPVRIYAPYGAMWFRYFMRRVAEAQGS
jgi:proline dehydrogenase